MKTHKKKGTDHSFMRSMWLHLQHQIGSSWLNWLLSATLMFSRLILECKFGQPSISVFICWYPVCVVNSKDLFKGLQLKWTTFFFRMQLNLKNPSQFPKKKEDVHIKYYTVSLLPRSNYVVLEIFLLCSLYLNYIFHWWDCYLSWGTAYASINKNANVSPFQLKWNPNGLKRKL